MFESGIHDRLHDLADQALPTSLAADAMKRGRRMRARRRFGAGICAVAVAATFVGGYAVFGHLQSSSATVGPAAAGPRVAVPAFTHTPYRDCPVSQLPLPAGVAKDFIPKVVDPSGRFIAGYQDSDTVWKTVLWTAGVPQVLSFPGTDSDVESINSNGVVAGVTTVSKAAGEHVYRYANGKYTILQVPMSGRWHAYGVHINTRGDIVANAEPANNPDAGVDVPLLWKAGSDRAVKLAMPKNADIAGITDNGNIVGTSPQGLNLKSYAYVWDSNGRNGRRLESPAGEYAVVDEISGNIGGGGISPNADGTDVWDATVEWNLQTGKMTTLSNIVTGAINAVNAAGWAADTFGEVDLSGVQANLLRLTPGGGTKNVVNAIADNGLVVGAIYDTDKGTNTAVTWHC
jgi:hypothetical protein